jgi:hypothetical protein
VSTQTGQLHDREWPFLGPQKWSPQEAPLDVCGIVYESVFMAETVRIDPSSHATLAEIARAKHIPLSEALARAVESYRRELMIQAMDADYGALRDDPKAWAEEQADRAAWETTSADGLDDE